MNIRTSYEGKRGCGYRAEGGLYLVNDGLGRYCGALFLHSFVAPTSLRHGRKKRSSWQEQGTPSYP